MQVFVPFVSPLETAKCLDPKRLNRQIKEALIMLDAIEGISNIRINHPVIKMYAPYRRWLKYYMKCLKAYRNYAYSHDPRRQLSFAGSYDDIAVSMTPPFLTEEFCIQHRRRLYTKDKSYYKRFAKYGESEENWYFFDGELRKYINGKRI